ncbi:MAG: RHS repeat-associated core domain-containing protein [Bacteroidales bacterium]|nr:RHS repeat-associated core domain-containing protein [Bacteroidales bacterium]
MRTGYGIGVRVVVLVVLSGWAPVAGALGTDNYVRTWVYGDSTGTDSRAVVSTVYYDGMGRERLRVSGTPQQPDAYTSVRTDYNGRGLRERMWLAVPGGEENIDAGVYSAAAKAFYGDDMPYSRYDYEPGSRNRVSAEYGPGKYWERHGTRYIRHGCTPSGDSCLKVLVDDEGNVYTDGTYAEGSLRVLESEDADGRRLLQFQNRTGKTVAERRLKDGVSAETRYVYDIYGDLRYVLTPTATAHLPATGTVDASVLEKYAQCYTYDEHHRLLTSRIQGGGVSEYVYDRFGHVLFSRDALQRANGEWTVTLYDERLRPAIRGTVRMSADAVALRRLYADSILVAVYSPANSEFMAYDVPDGFTGFWPEMAWYYDDYRFMESTNSSQKTMFEATRFPATGKLTGTATKTENSDPIFTVMRYDARGNIDLLGKWDCFLNEFRLTIATGYDFTGKALWRTETLQAMTEGTVQWEDTARFSYSYDALGRLTEEELSVNGSAPQTVRTCEYDGVGRLVREWRGTDVEYGYDIRSRLTSATCAVYTHNVSYTADGSGGDDTATPSYTMVNSTTDSWHADDSGLPGYSVTLGYSYDALGRLKQARDKTGSISERLETDADANVVAVQRHYKGTCVQDAVLDFDGEVPTSVRDVSTPYYQDAVGRFAPGEYAMSHDILGRLVSDESRQIKSVRYSPWGNLPQRIKLQNDDEVFNTYLSDGTLFKRRFCSSRIVTVTRVNSKGDTIIRQVSRPVVDSHVYLGSFDYDWYYSLRRLNTSVGFYDSRSRQHYWHLTNNQGSVMAVVDGKGKVVQRSGLYPSGTPFVLPVDISADTVSMRLGAVSDRLHIGNRWQSHSGLNWYDNTARMHDPLLLRFTTQDPLAGKYGPVSPYSHCQANPANLLDPSGMRIIADEWSQHGIMDGFSENEQKYISFDSKGVLDKDLLEKCKSTSKNFGYLKELAQSDYDIRVEKAYEVKKATGIAIMGSDDADYNKGETLMPGVSVKDALSPDEDIHVYTSGRLSLRRRATNLAHELYGHASFFINGKNPIHDANKTDCDVGKSGFTVFGKLTNLELENRISEVETEAKYNYENFNKNIISESLRWLQLRALDLYLPLPND